jgi:FkbM family methyltransferase
MLIHLELRAELTLTKLLGRVAPLPWTRLMPIWMKSCTAWPTRDLLRVIGKETKDIARFQTPFGEICCPEADQQFLSVLVLDQLRGVYDRYRSRIRPRDCVIDLGAHVGTFTRYALSRGAAKVIAVEPDPFHVECLQRAFCKEIKSRTVEVIQAGAWDSYTQLHFHSEGVLSKVTDTGETVIETVTVDELAAREPRVDFIKADIEGSERVALRGATRTLAKFKPRLALCTYHLPDDPVVIPAEVKKANPQYSSRFNFSRSQVYCT